MKTNHSLQSHYHKNQPLNIILKIPSANHSISFKDLCEILEVTLFGNASKLYGKTVSGNYILLKERNDMPSWKKDDEDVFLSRMHYIDIQRFEVCSGNFYMLNYIPFTL